MGNDKLKGWTLYCNGVNFGEKFFKMAGVLEDFSKPNPDAPKDIEDSYTLTVNGRTVSLSDDKDKVEATCYYKDNFDIGEGVRECFEKLKKAREEIKVGDMVEIVVPGYGYAALNTSFFEKEGIMSWAAPYRFGVVPEEGIKGNVVHVASNNLFVVQTNDEYYGNENYKNLTCCGGIYVINRKGLRKVVD